MFWLIINCGWKNYLFLYKVLFFYLLYFLKIYIHSFNKFCNSIVNSKTVFRNPIQMVSDLCRDFLVLIRTRIGRFEYSFRFIPANKMQALHTSRGHFHSGDLPSVAIMHTHSNRNVEGILKFWLNFDTLVISTILHNKVM